MAGERGSMNIIKYTYLLLAIVILSILISPASAEITTTFYPTNDQHMQETTDTSTYTTIRNAGGDSVSSQSETFLYASWLSTSVGMQYDDMARGGFSFNTSSLPDDAIISSAFLNFTRYDIANGYGNFNLGITGFSPSSCTTYVAGDYDSFGSVEYASRIEYASLGETFSFSLNTAGIANISKTEYTNIMTRNSWDLDSSAPALAKSRDSYIRVTSVDNAIESYRPQLVVVYTTAPVAAFSGNVTSGYPPFPILFTDESTNTPTTWSWVFGDSGTSSSQSPTHWYNVTIGNTLTQYTVSLNASNAAGYDWECISTQRIIFCECNHWRSTISSFIH